MCDNSIADGFRHLSGYELKAKQATKRAPRSLVLLLLPVGSSAFEKPPRGERLLIYDKSAFEIKSSLSRLWTNGGHGFAVGIPSPFIRRLSWEGLQCRPHFSR